MKKKIILTVLIIAAVAGLVMSGCGSSKDSKSKKKAPKEVTFDESESYSGPYEFDGHTYYYVNVPMAWNEAVIYCKDKGGHLAIISSSEEQEFIASQLADLPMNNYWIGLSRETESLDWSWVNSDPLEYSNWASGEPNNYSNSKERYVQIVAKNYNSSKKIGYWNDVSIDGAGQSAGSFYAFDMIGLILEVDGKVVN